MTKGGSVSQISFRQITVDNLPPVPLIDVGLQNEPLLPELTAVAAKVLKSGQFILGSELESFEASMADFLGVKHALGVSSGTDALLLGLMVLGVGPGDEVICPGFTFFASAGSIARTGARPVFVDACPVSYNLDLKSVREMVTSRTKAIMPVHIFGQSAEMDELLTFAKKYGLAVIEDGAQALGAKYRGRSCGTMGDFGAFSFFPTKNLGGFGDAGLLVTNDDHLAHAARRQRVHGMEPRYYHVEVGGNFRMDAMQAALLRVKAPHQVAYNDARRAHAKYYQEQLALLEGVVVAKVEDRENCSRQTAHLQSVGAQLVLPVAFEHNEHIWNQYTVRVLGEGRRDALLTHLREAGIGCDIYYPVPVHQQKCFQSLGTSSLPVVEQLSQEVLSIPVFPELTEAQQDRVIAAIASFLDSSR
jgi:dTDP-4-amino-4,6-dideoxygalactose transaminase